jgi:hypothetical protein
VHPDDSIPDETVFYSIHPKPAMREAIDKENAEWGEVLAEPQLWSRNEWGMKALLAVRLVDIKEAFLWSLYAAFDVFGESGNPVGLFLRSLCPCSGQADEFDQWWTIERFEWPAQSYERYAQRRAAL